MNVLVRENKKIAHIIENEIRPYLVLAKKADKEEVSKLKEGINQLKDLSLHYGKKGESAVSIYGEIRNHGASKGHVGSG